ncbi:hypothetical protein XELAEV_18044599mg [Xenopus laevis]|uniref:Uncharacterized protein n=1 Tax=Xenopus laevis TaxID=8355 RepID=A0A974H3X6_XENLA|nr:hypothetical protein XELAEV_18044599mg [Xenopus laevis]
MGDVLHTILPLMLLFSQGGRLTLWKEGAANEEEYYDCIGFFLRKKNYIFSILQQFLNYNSQLPSRARGVSVTDSAAAPLNVANVPMICPVILHYRQEATIVHLLTVFGRLSYIPIPS